MPLRPHHASARGSARRGAAAGVLTAALVLAAPALGQSPPEAPPLEGGVAPDEIAHTTLVHPPYSHTLGIHRARPIHLKLFLADRTRFADPQGLAAVKFDADDDPGEKSDDFRLTLFGVNSGRGEIVFNSTMQTLAIYGATGSGEGRFRAPHGIAATVDGRVYVADTGNRRLARLRWDPVGRGLTWIGEWPVAEPFDVAPDARGQVYVTDRDGHAVRRFSDPSVGGAPSPVEAERWPLPDDVSDPLGLAVGDSLERWYRPRHYRLYLVDQGGARLRAYDAGGAVVAETSPAAAYGDRGPAPGRFLYVELDYFGNVYVSDPEAGAVMKLDPDLAPLAVFAGSGKAAEALDEPRGVAIWRRFGQVFVAEREGAQYFFVGTDFEVDDPLTVREDGDGGALELFLTEAAEVRIAFRDAAGDTLAVADTGAWPAGPVTVRWPARRWLEPPDEGWRERAETVRIEARPTYSSRRKFSRVREVAFDPGGS
ncbi:MAG TPA: NHL repeat-containing protein [Gemmatimonadota bacterium]|nr:NHL repeat-containing protein [Gemmatimonadota bacterium]